MFKNKKGFIIKLRQSRTFKGMSVCLALNFLFQIAQPSMSLALTEGPSQPEVQSFEPIGTTQMVDMFTGDFNYNIPLFNLPGPNGGYPVNLAYHAGATMDDEASWVGLGWNINVGSLVRSMRGLPDEFKSEAASDDALSASADHDYLDVQSDMMQSWTFGVNGAYAPELFGGEIFSMGASVYYNNYNGVGLSIDPSFTFGNPNSTTFSVGLSLDSENGAGVNASVNLANNNKEDRRFYKLGFSFDGSLSIDLSMGKKFTEEKWSSAQGDYKESSGGGTFGASSSFARDNFVPSIANNVDKYNISLNMKFGGSVLAAYDGYSAGLFFNTEDYSKEDKEGRKRLVVGYAKAGSESSTSHYTKDFSRSNEGQLTKATQFLPVSQYTYDIYNSTGQGLSGYFRARRADVGRSHDPYVYNSSVGISLSFDASTQHFAVGGGMNFGESSQGAWDENNDLEYDFKNPTLNQNVNAEVVYYQAHGEQTILAKDELAYMENLSLVDLKLAPKSGDNLTAGYRKMATPTGDYSNGRTSAKRVVRNTLIHNLKNSEVEKLGEFKVNYFTNASQALTYPGSGNTSVLDRSIRSGVYIDEHPAGYKILNQEGSYYIYGLPAYNHKEVENLFSTPAGTNNTDVVTPASGLDEDGNENKDYYKVNGTHKFIDKKTKSPYAHSYLLTGVQGADYVDIDNNGPSDEDLGYWVKFNYLTTTGSPAHAIDKYKWRTPYDKNQYNQGQMWTAADDKESYQYGEKELWYLAQIETKSHIAVFVLSPRDDMKSAKGEMKQDIDNGVASEQGMKIDEIRLYEKNEFKSNTTNPIPLQVVHFNYASTDKLCVGAPNATSGKLTLESVYFTSNGSTRGELNKYKFDYTKTGSDNLADNPAYVTNSYDPWGGYKPKGVPSNYEHHVRFPYVNQFNQNWSSTVWEPDYLDNTESYDAKRKTKDKQDELVSAWCLKKITLPSGGAINIEYESDDYSHVQHKVANQMFKIEKLGDFNNPLVSDNQLYTPGELTGEFHNDGTAIDEEKRRIYFKLEFPIPVGSTSLTSANQKVYDDYVLPMIQDEAGQRNLYFKTKIELVENVFDYLSGYVPLEDNIKKTINSTDHYNVGVKLPSGSEDMVDVNGDGTPEQCYTRGYVTIKASKKKNGNYFESYHPIALAAWTYMQTNAQMILHNSIGGDMQLGADPSINDMINKTANLLSIIPTTAANFGAIRLYCHSRGFARTIDLNNSVIRLASPDKVKFGGGHRVKQISINDKWSSDINGDSQFEDRIYGQSYDYTIKENGQVISSGVAQYEPQLGGDENALKYPIYYFDKQNVFTKNNLFAEAPFNENLFPGASVGYRQVTVKSINTNDRINQAKNSSPELRGRTGGVTVHKFYTAKDFPTIVEQTRLSEENNTKDVFNVPIPIPFVGTISRNLFHGTQSYKIELNDMHGKPMSVESFQLNGYEIDPNPITSVEYEYQALPYQYGNDVVLRLDNNVNIIANDNTHKELLENGETAKRLMGVEVDLFTDQKEVKTFNTSFGLQPNVDVALPFLPVITVWPSFSNHKSLLRTYVTNKVVHKTGILKKTKTRDLQTVNETEVLAYDEKSGNPLLSRIKNEFGDDFYSYNIPAYYAYARMGHAYQNINYTFDTQLSSISDPLHKTVRFSVTGSEIDNLVRGDEVLITETTTAGDQYKKGYFIGFDYSEDGVTPTKGILHVDETLDNENAAVTLKVIRSGYRNHYSSMAANYLTKGKLTDVALTDYDVASVENGPMIKTKKIAGNVLSATASLYKDDWLTSDIGEDVSKKVVDNPFLTGNSGIFRPYKSYTYVGPRKQKTDFVKRNTNTPTNTDAELYNDGVMEEVPMFTWEIGNLENYVSNWEWVNEVTKYSSDAYEIENVNRLGIYSSALYGYDNSLTIGVGGNSSYFELGVVDFETAKRVGTTQGEIFENEWEFGESMKQTNLNFYNVPKSMSKFITSEHYDIRSAKYNLNGDGKIEITTTIPYSYYTSVLGDIEDNFGITLNSTKNNALAGNGGLYFNAECNRDKSSNGTGTSACASSVNVMINGQSVACTKLTLTPFYAASTNGFKLMKTNSEYTGKISLLLNKQVTTGAVNISTTQFVTNKAHTGKKSMKLYNTVHYDQFKLKVIKDKKYVVSMWISRDNTNVARYASSTSNPISIGQITNGNFVALPTGPSGKAKYTFGKVVEGWQKVDVEFYITEDGQTMSIEFAPGTSSLYVDDIRFSPKTGGITTYVYDPAKFWLRASLNVDNYATLFFYDEEGNLTLKKQETEEGIFTITESRGHVSEGGN